MKKIILLLALAMASITAFAQKTENLKVSWPEEYKWKVGSDQEDETMHMIELIPEKETFDNWTIIGTMLSIKGAAGVGVDTSMNIMFQQTKIHAPNAKMTEIDRDNSAAYPWVIFKIESPAYDNSSKTESQVYYIVQGKQSLYANFVALKEKKLSEKFVKKWTAVFKSAEIVE